MQTCVSARRTILLSAILAALCAAAGGAQSVVLYDDFNAKVIDPDRWYGQDFGFSPTDRREQVREIASNTLRLASRLYSDPAPFSTSRNGGTRIRFTNPAAVTAIQADMRVVEVESAACSASTVASARASIQGFFFNSGGGAAPDNRTGEVSAAISIFRPSNSTEADGVLTAAAVVSRCTNPDCSAMATIGSAAMGTVDVKQKVRAGVEWDEAADRFLFRLGDGPPTPISYGPLPVAPAVINSKFIDVSLFAQGCTGVRSVAAMDLRVDNVLVNPIP